MPAMHVCPHCNGPISLTEAMGGRNVQCPRCRNVFQAPGGGSEAPPPPLHAVGASDVRKMSSARIEFFRRRRRWAFVKPLVFTLAASAVLIGVGSFVWRDLKKKGVMKTWFAPKKRTPREEAGVGRGFHIMPCEYWDIFDNPDLLAKPVVKAPDPKPEVKKIDAEGLTVHTLKPGGTYYIVNDMGGLVPSAVGVWVSPNRLGQGREAFYGEPGEKVSVTHWVCNYGGFKVYRVLNGKKRRGPGNKLYEAGWVLGIYLNDEEGNPVR